ncbi:MAG: histidine kinase [Ferruginibacter sp.]|nr:histidine kinase [Ferruginibacter sp.]
MLRHICGFYFFLFSCALHINGQTRTIDSLKRNIVIAQNPHQKLMALFAFCDQRQSLSSDTLCKYAALAKQVSIIQNDKFNVALGEYQIATCLVKKGDLDNALKICERNTLKIKEHKGNAEPLMRLTALKAQILIRSTKYKEGIAEVYRLLRIAEQSRDTAMQMIAKNAIGWANMEMDQSAEALRWFYKALNTSDNIVHHEKNSNIYSNMAAVYKQLNQNDSAKHYVQKAITFSRKNENLFFLANSLNILADIYISTKKAPLAEVPLTEALELRKEIGDPYYILSDMSQLAIYYANISKPEKGIEIGLEGIEMAKDFNVSSKLPYLYYALGENYKMAGNYLEYSKTLEKIMIFKDSLSIANSAEARAEMEALYELEKKEKQITIQKLDISKKNAMVFGSLSLLIFTTLLAWLLMRGYRKNQQIKFLKMQAEEKQLSARAVLSAEESERKRISRDLHDSIGAYATVLIANTEQLKKQVKGDSVQATAENVCESAQNIMGSIQETIWVLNNDVITITDFIDRVKLYSKKMLQHFPYIEIRFKEQLEIDFKLSPAEALHLFRIMQEGLQNAIKHANPKNIMVIVDSNEAVFISIKDDGTKFNKENVRNGNGLLNMQHRAKEAGYELKILSDNNGTEIILQKKPVYAG